MRFSAFSARLTHAAVCILLAAAFVVVALRHISLRHQLPFWLPFHTSDDFMRDLTGTAQGSEKLLQALAALPPGPLAAIYHEDDDGAALMAYVASYLAWPREMPLLAMKKAPISQSAARQTGDFIGIFYCHLQPPADAPNPIRFGRDIYLVRRELPEGNTR